MGVSYRSLCILLGNISSDATAFGYYLDTLDMNLNLAASLNYSQQANEVEKYFSIMSFKIVYCLICAYFDSSLVI